MSTAVCLTMAVSARADELDDRRAELQTEISQTRTDLNESSSSLRQAAIDVERTESALAAARAALEQTRRDLAAAAARDKTMAAKLVAARVALATARAAVVVALDRLDAQKSKAGEIVRDQYQQRTNLIPIAAMLQSGSTADLQTRLQWSTTLFDTTAAEIDRMVALKRQLEVARAKATTLEREVAADRQAAAANLATKKGLESKAETQEANVARLLDDRRAIEDQAADDVAADKRRYADLNTEAESVERRIAERIAKAKAEAARKAATERAARERARIEAARARAAAERARVAAEQARVAAAKAKARAARAARAAKARQARARAEREERQARAEQRRAEAKAKQARARAERSRADSDRSERKRTESRSERSNQSRDNASSSSRKSSGSSGGSSARKQKATPKKKSSRSSSGGGRSGSHGFVYPVNASISSPYGMRFHPILKYWKLHDGTDFGASCGTPIRAAYSGRVAEKYFNSGYGNRLMIDHGEVDGSYVTTGYNHATRYTVSVGDRVSKGEVVGYVGSTGYSTGCHLHLMTWVDGDQRNPMSWF